MKIEKISELFDRLFKYYLVQDNSMYKVRLEELSRKIKDTPAFSLTEIYYGIIEECNFFPSVRTFNDSIKKMRDIKYEVLKG